ncbi:hypothetical protein ACBJ59_10495 [Nonomuraea sp. MTCD27]|uniref:hypothetical protein n=1 Tax=Nonomuraea sp. MTCD27 TaxID=1676747 RepID=UPI0035BEBC5A
METAIPAFEQIGGVDLTSWRVVPGEANPHKDEQGSWAIVGGDENDLHIEVLDAGNSPRRVAEFIVEAVQEHATKLRRSAAYDDISRERDKLSGRPRGADLYELERPRVVAMMGVLGKLAEEAYEPAPAAVRDEQERRIYGEVTCLAALAVCWMEAFHARYNMPPDL